jgi:hypothetical protein
MKLASNTALQRNLEKQAPIYQKASDAEYAIKVKFAPPKTYDSLTTKLDRALKLLGVGLITPARAAVMAEAYSSIDEATAAREGFDPACFELRTGQPRDVLAPALARAQAQGLLAPEVDGRWVPTELGRRFLNDLQAMFLPDSGHSPEAKAAKPLASPAAIG